MISRIKNVLAAAALLSFTGAVAFAQSEMKVDVPFAFEIPTATLPSGTYTITHLTNQTVPFYKLRHESGKVSLVVAAMKTGRHGIGNPGQVAFECAGEHCALKAFYWPTEPQGDGVLVRLRNAPSGLKTAEVRIPGRL